MIHSLWTEYWIILEIKEIPPHHRNENSVTELIFTNILIKFVWKVVILYKLHISAAAFWGLLPLKVLAEYVVVNL